MAVTVFAFSHADPSNTEHLELLFWLLLLVGSPLVIPFGYFFAAAYSFVGGIFLMAVVAVINGMAIGAAIGALFGFLRRRHPNKVLRK